MHGNSSDGSTLTHNKFFLAHFSIVEVKHRNSVFDANFSAVIHAPLSFTNTRTSNNNCNITWPQKRSIDLIDFWMRTHHPEFFDRIVSSFFDERFHLFIDVFRHIITDLIKINSRIVYVVSLFNNLRIRSLRRDIFHLLGDLLSGFKDLATNRIFLKFSRSLDEIALWDFS